MTAARSIRGIAMFESQPCCQPGAAGRHRRAARNVGGDLEPDAALDRGVDRAREHCVDIARGVRRLEPTLRHGFGRMDRQRQTVAAQHRHYRRIFGEAVPAVRTVDHVIGVMDDVEHAHPYRSG